MFEGDMSESRDVGVWFFNQDEPAELGTGYVLTLGLEVDTLIFANVIRLSGEVRVSWCTWMLVPLCIVKDGNCNC